MNHTHEYALKRNAKFLKFNESIKIKPSHIRSTTLPANTTPLLQNFKKLLSDALKFMDVQVFPEVNSFITELTTSMLNLFLWLLDEETGKDCKTKMNFQFNFLIVNVGK